MINQYLIDILNSDAAWAFVGSGCSVDAGLPSWEELLIKTINKAESSPGVMPADVLKQVHDHQASHRLTKAFSLLKSHYGSSEIDSIVCSIFDVSAEPGEASKILARWPFASYVTTNYDDLLERALMPYGGWVAVGNTSDENAKISGDVRQVVWHPHGGVRLGNKNTRLVLGSSDYDEIYPAGSPTLAALEAVCRMKRIVFIGFGFRDPDLVAMLQRISRLVTPARPAFGFLANCRQKDRKEYWRQYKIDIIPYVAKGADHSDLLNVLKGYGAFVLERSSRFGRIVSTPDYDLETVGLLTHNRLCRSGYIPDSAAIDCIAKGLVLAQLKTETGLSVNQLIDAMPHGSMVIEQAVRRVITILIAQDDIKETNGVLTLTNTGNEVARQGKADYELARDKFQKSIESRAIEHLSEDSVVQNVREVSARYIEQICKERGLGVAQQLAESGGMENRARAVALLQGAKKELEHATNREAALAVIQCIWNVLSAPRPEERRYLGLLTQAYFGRQLLSMDPAAIGVQRTNLSSTVFIADSNFIIPLLAEASVGHQYAVVLYKKLVSLGCKIATSDFLLDETVEHAQWAWKLLNIHGSVSPTTIDVARGARGYRPNAFLVGYLNHPRFGPGMSWKRYFAHLFNSSGELPDVGTVTDRLRAKGLVVQPFSEWEGFTDELFADRDQVQQEIERRRRKNMTFTHERQVKAEAEVVIIVTQIRHRKLCIVGHVAHDAFFLSNSRVVDNLPRQACRVCLTSESLLEWILSVGELHEDEANAVFDQLLWEISKEGVDVVPRLHLLHLFHNTIDISRAKLDEIMSEHRELVREHYAVDPEKAFLDIDPLSAPSVAEEVSKKVLSAMQSRLAQEQHLRTEAERKAKTAVKDAKEYERLKAEKKHRQAKAKRKMRAAQSKHGGKGKKYPKKK